MCYSSEINLKHIWLVYIDNSKFAPFSLVMFSFY